MSDREAIAGGEGINLALREHQSTARWDYQQAASDLNGWVEKFRFQFKLEYDTPALSIQALPGCYGRYRAGRNGFALARELGIDSRHAGNDPAWRVCGTLLHLALHAWQDARGTAGWENYHNNEFREKAFSLGLKTDRRGNTEYVAGETPFVALLRAHGVAVPEQREAQPHRTSRNGSKLRLFVCPACGVKVRAGAAGINIWCGECKVRFQPRSPTGDEAGKGGGNGVADGGGGGMNTIRILQDFPWQNAEPNQ